MSSGLLNATSAAPSIPWWRGALILACCVPALVAYNLPPSPTLFNQAGAVALWGSMAALFGLAQLHGASPARHTAALMSAIVVVAGLALASTALGALPSGLMLSAFGMLACAAAMVASGAGARRGPAREEVLTALFWAWVVAGLLSGAVGLLQVFAATVPDGDVIAKSGLAGRAVGNLRQPNHLSSLLLWSAVAVIPLLCTGRLKRGAGASLFAFMVLGLVLSGSRTGMVGVLVLAVWGLLDRRLGRDARALLMSAPLWFGLFWLLMSWWARETGNTFGAAAHVSGADPSSSRFAIWSNTLALIARHPWGGVGFGEFNFAWTLTPFPDRPIAFFDHTHNLPLQLAVELGLPSAALVLALLGWALWRAWRNSARAAGADGLALRAAFMMVLMMALHSQLEYPLWYAYFLLPTAWLWGYCLAASPAPEPPAAVPTRGSGRLVVAGLAMVGASALLLVDYQRVVQIFEPDDDAPSLAQRIADGRNSLLFAHHADYAAATTADDPASVAGAFRRAPHYLLDTRLMIAWSKALAAQGDMDGARHMAQRLREFRNPGDEEFFAPCKEAPPHPFQCQPPNRVIDWREFR